MFQSKYILFWSENPDELAKSYTDVLELEYLVKTDIPAKDGLEKDYGHDLKLSDTNILWIGHHDSIKGVTKDPLRRMINLNTDEVQKWYEKVRDTGCKIIQEPILTPFATVENQVYVCAWKDPEGNCWQFMGKL
ncbi:MAG: VOC family protein [Candidatus Dojkabacteria bacterium]|nr:VOC family protein [Candidatus Dojkabacteria bacterium]MDQ7020969.1 VOC family protein [Candidatus Dojkabacteria bacterium]